MSPAQKATLEVVRRRVDQLGAIARMLAHWPADVDDSFRAIGEMLEDQAAAIDRAIN